MSHLLLVTCRHLKLNALSRHPSGSKLVYLMLLDPESMAVVAVVISFLICVQLRLVSLRFQSLRSGSSTVDAPTCRVARQQASKNSDQRSEPNESQETRSRKSTTNKKSFKCELCGSKFDRHDHLLRHLVYKCRTEKIKPFECEKCGHGYSRPDSLRSHKCRSLRETIAPALSKLTLPQRNTKFNRLESPIKTKLPNHRIKKRVAFDIGEQSCEPVDTQDTRTRNTTDSRSAKTFKCKQCDSTFPSVSALRRHMLIHGEKRFECEKCGRKFTRSDHKKRHMVRCKV